MLDSWMEWKRQCALDLCAPETRSKLRGFAYARFRGMLVRLRRDTRMSAPSPKEAWHLLEAHLAVTSTRGGKKYKDWLFARVRNSRDRPVDVIQGGASLILRDVVRDFLCKETSPAGTMSLEAPLPGGGTNALTLADLLPGSLDPVETAAAREYDTLARRHAAELFGETTHRERVILLAKELGVPLWDEDVQEAAGCRKTMLHAVYHDFVVRTGQHLAREYSEDGSESVLALTLMTLNHLKKAVREWGISERSVSNLFKIVGGR
jgi:hypothetical protein